MADMRNLESDEPFLESLELAKERVRAIFENRGLQAPDSRITRIAQEVIDGERGFVDVRIALREFATRNADSGIPGTDGGGTGDKGLDAIIAEEYPSLAWAVDHPDLGPILKRAAEEEWSPLKLQNAVQGTDWWKTKTSTQRELQILRETDPETYRQRITDAQNQVLTLAQDLGVQITEAQASQIGKQQLENNLDQRQLTQAILGKVDVSDTQFARRLDEGQYGGAISEAARQVEQVSNAYLLELTPADRRKWVTDIVSGNRTQESFREYAEEMAVAQMPVLQRFIDRGLSPVEGLRPYQQTFARMLEMNPEAVDWKDPRYQRVLQVQDGKEQRLATTSEAAARIREEFHDEWNQTGSAKQAASKLTGQIANMFGRRA